MRVVITLLLTFAALGQDLGPEERRALDRERARRGRELAMHATTTTLNDACANGTFEPSIVPAQWSGKSGYVTYAGDAIMIEDGLSPGPLESPAAHHTVVAAGVDPIAGISTVAPGGRSTHALRLGNRDVRAGAEKLSKTFRVDPTRSVIGFSYAVVYQDPKHEEFEQPSFEVRVLDAGGQPLPASLVHLGDGRGSKLVAGHVDGELAGDAGDPKNTRYIPWSCGQIDLGNYAGSVVTVEFVTEDCALGGHFSYAYIDEFCGGGPCGPNFSLGAVSQCGRGTVCFDYTLLRGVQPGISVSLDVVQDGVVRDRVTGPLPCMPIDPAAIRGLDPLLVAFDIVATATFTTGDGGTFVQRLGDSAKGITPGANDDYRVTCDGGCIPGIVNLIANGDFERSPLTTSAVMPGQTGVLDAASARDVAGTWNLCRENGHMLVANGSTCGTEQLLWAETVPVTPGATYSFCAKFKQLPAAAFDVTPRVEVRFNGLPRPAQTSDLCGMPAGTQEITIPANVSSLTIEIWLLAGGPGDGNDVAVDEISLQKTSGPGT